MYKTGDVINLNHEDLFLQRFENGHTYRVEVKFGRESCFIDVEKNSASAFVQMFPKTDESKYAVDMCEVKFQPDAMLNRKIFENFRTISDAQATLHRFGVGL